MYASALRLCFAVSVCLAVAACSKDTGPTQPTSSTPPSETEGLTSSVTAPRPVSPAIAAQIRNLDQPVTLVVANAVVTQAATATYTFEVASDSAFNSKVYIKNGVPAGANGETSVTIDRLPGGSDYYWHARADGGGTVGLFSGARLFTIGPAIVVNAPAPVSPVGNVDTNARPALVVTNATKSGPVGALTYRFEIATNSGFNPIAVTTNVPENSSGRTTFQPTTDLPAESTIFWRVTAIDQANGVSGPPSTAASFKTTFAIDLQKAVFLHSPDISSWPQTANLQLVEQDGGHDGAMCMRFTDPGWPDSPWPFGGPDPNFGVFANQWYFAKINGTWYGGAGEWLYRGGGTCKAGQGTLTIGPDSGFGPPFSTWVPRVGELVGFAVTSVARPGVRPTVNERSNIVVQGWRDTTRGSPSLTRLLRR